jgi:protocatechuate 3,4-dioxygenase beta subunit
MILLLSILLLAGFQSRGQGPGVLGGIPEGPPLPEPFDREPEPVGTEIVAGTVLHGDTTRPFSHVQVELRREDYAKWASRREKTCNPARDMDDPKLRRLVMTDETGRFIFRDVVPGRYYIVAQHEGYLRAQYNPKERSPRGMVLEVGPQADTDMVGGTRPTRPGMPSGILQDLVLRMHPAPTITGRVYGEDGARVPSAIIQAYQYRYAPLNGRTLLPIRSIFSDDNGEYRLFWLNPGRYVIAAAYSDYILQPWKEHLRFTPNLPDGDNRYPVVYYPNVERPAEARPVTIGGVEAPPIDLTLWQRPRFDVEIKLIGASVPENATLIMVPYGGDLCAAMDYGIIPGKDGVVAIRDVPAGQYMLMAVKGRDALSEFHSLIVDQPIRDHRIQIIEPIQIQVDVGAPPGANIQDIRVNLTRVGNDASYTKSAEYDSSGKYGFRGVPTGSYYVTADSPPGYYVSDIVAIGPLEYCQVPPVLPAVRSSLYQYLDSHGHLNREKPLIVPSVFPGEACKLAVTVRAGGRLLGRVIDRAGTPVAGALVLGFPQGVFTGLDNKVAFSPPDRFLSTTTDGDGRFVLVGAAQSTAYKLFAFEDLDLNLVYDPTLIERFPNRDLIEIEENGGTTQRNRSQQLQGIRTVSVPGFRSPNQNCSENALCILRVIPAEDTRDIVP